MKEDLRVIISGGGTGGHIFPAIAIANEIRKRQPSAKILFVGANGRMEMDKVPQAGYEIRGLNIAGFQRGSVIKNAMLPLKIMQSLVEAFKIIKQFKPDVAIGVGGYASGPLLHVAGLLGIPTVIQEQNSFAGVTNKILARSATVICTAYEEMEKVFPAKKIVVTGNPVRAEITNATATKKDAAKHFGLDENKQTVLIIGGSLGARTLNHGVEAALERIKESDVQFLWQTGKLYYEHCKIVAEGVPQLKALQFIDKMDLTYTLADVIVSRAGALSISELQLVGKPAILVPSPNVTEDHQTHNAMALVKNRAALIINDDEAKVNLIGAAIDLLYDAKLRTELAANIKRMAKPSATEHIVDQILKAVK